jgi:hypothetical protein
VLKPHFEVNKEARMVDIINMKVSLMEVDEETHGDHRGRGKRIEEEEIMEVMVEVIKVVAEVIEVNNQITIQIVTTTRNLGTWQKTIIKGSMMHEMESCNKGIMHQLAIKVMNNYLGCSTWQIQ